MSSPRVLQSWCPGCSGDGSPGVAASGGNTSLHAHLLGSNVVSRHPDLIASAIIALTYFALAAYSGYKFSQQRQFMMLLVVAFALLVTGFGFATRAGISNTSSANVNRTTVIAEQFFLVTGQLLLLDAHTTLSRDLVARASIGHWPSTFTWINRAILVVSWILDTVAFTARAPDDIYSHNPTPLHTNLRIAGAVLPFLTAFANACYLPFEKIRHSEIDLAQLGILDLMAWLLVVGPFYAFLVTAVTSETSGLVHSRTWFYVAFGACQALAVVPILALPLAQYFQPGPYALGFRAAKLQEDIDNGN